MQFEGISGVNLTCRCAEVKYFAYLFATYMRIKALFSATAFKFLSALLLLLRSYVKGTFLLFCFFYSVSFVLFLSFCFFYPI